MPIFPYYNRQRDPIPLDVSDKHVGLRIMGFVAAVLIAVGFISYGVTRIGYKETGYHELSAAVDQELPLYQSSVHARFLFRGSSDQIKAALGGANQIYTQSLKENYKLLDAEREYPGCVNVASLNAHLNEDVQVSPKLFAVLTDAWAKTEERRGYSMFAWPVYHEWRSILTLTEPEDFDPLCNPDEAERLEILRSRVGDPSQVRLVVVDEEACILRVEVTPEYLAFLDEMELEPRVLDLNLLRDAYLLELIARDLEEQGLCEGYLSTDGGLILSLSGQNDGEYCLYGWQKEQPALAATVKVSPGSACSLFTAFSLVGDAGEFYRLEEKGTLHMRNPYLPADGIDRELLLSSCVVRPDGALVEACYENIYLRQLDSAGELERAARESGGMVAWMLQGDETGRFYTNPAAEGVFLPAD